MQEQTHLILTESGLAGVSFNSPINRAPKLLAMRGIPPLRNWATRPSIILALPRYTILVVEVDLDTQAYSSGPASRSAFFPAPGIPAGTGAPQKGAATTSLGGSKRLLCGTLDQHAASKGSSYSHPSSATILWHQRCGFPSKNLDMTIGRSG